MTYFQNSTDASRMYRQNSAAEGNNQDCTAVRGNLSDVIKNATLFRGTFVSPVIVHVVTPGQDANLSAVYGPVW
jgi:hypothetical protein